MQLWRIGSALLAAGLALAAADARAQQPPAAVTTVTLFGDDDYPPYSFVENGQFKGLYVDLLQLAAKALPAYRIDLQPRPWKRGLSELEQGTAFALFPPGKKAERAYIFPYSTPLYREKVVLFCNDSATARTVFPDHFTGLTIGVNAGFLLSERLIQAVKAGLVKLDAAKGNEANLRKLALKRIDCYASDRNAALYSAKKLAPYFRELGFTLRQSVELSAEDTYIAYSARNAPPYKDDFIARMNAAIDALRSSGALGRIEARYLH